MAFYDIKRGTKRYLRALVRLANGLRPDGTTWEDWLTSNNGGGGSGGGGPVPYQAGEEYTDGTLIINGGGLYQVTVDITAAANTEFDDITQTVLIPPSMPAMTREEAYVESFRHGAGRTFNSSAEIMGAPFAWFTGLFIRWHSYTSESFRLTLFPTTGATTQEIDIWRLDRSVDAALGVRLPGSVVDTLLLVLNENEATDNPLFGGSDNASLHLAFSVLPDVDYDVFIDLDGVRTQIMPGNSVSFTRDQSSQVADDTARVNIVANGVRLGVVTSTI